METTCRSDTPGQGRVVTHNPRNWSTRANAGGGALQCEVSVIGHRDSFTLQTVISRMEDKCHIGGEVFLPFIHNVRESETFLVSRARGVDIVGVLGSTYRDPPSKENEQYRKPAHCYSQEHVVRATKPQCSYCV